MKKKKRFVVTAMVEVECERVIEACTEEEAEQIANEMNGDEWLDYAQNDYVNVDWIEEERKKPTVLR